ncbi:hypothetical protein SteCoe_19690 [Stentor coeruleus]|uniref:Uncharacterized protein n=1 Tax=Stentor coeruleus TaxID=5963 RepID=A0A1R2BTZ8_9CILI|nr:hypothetical protein SteCoe_19690 [Stentor coeruleus]
MNRIEACRLSPNQHMKLNCTANLLVLLSFIISFNVAWFSYKSSEFSLTQIYMKNDTWQSFGDFKEMCNEKYLNKYEDLVDDCKLLDRFKLAGTLYILMTGFAMLITVYNILSSAAKGWELEIGALEYNYPHVLAPGAYTVAIIIWIISLNVGFTSEFYATYGFYMADFTTAASFGVAIHFVISSRFFESNDETQAFMP